MELAALILPNGLNGNRLPLDRLCFVAPLRLRATSLPHVVGLLACRQLAAPTNAQAEWPLL